MIGLRVGRPGNRPSHRHVLLLAASLLLVGAVPVQAGDRYAYGARPASSDGNGHPGGYLLSARAGTAISDAVEILNFTDDPLTFDVYAVDAVQAADGTRTPASRDAVRSGPATWIEIDQAAVDVPPQGSAVTSFAVAVPAETTIGHYTAALVVEPQRDEGEGTILNRTRIGLWVEVKVGTEGNPPPVPGAPLAAWWLPVAVGALAAGAVLYVIWRDRRRRGS
jgi:hypothetical protein